MQWPPTREKPKTSSQLATCDLRRADTDAGDHKQCDSEETECTTKHLSKYAQAQSREYHRLRYNFFRLPLADHFCNLHENSE